VIPPPAKVIAHWTKVRINLGTVGRITSLGSWLSVDLLRGILRAASTTENRERAMPYVIQHDVEVMGTIR
jgi:hypothetical protein